MSYGENNLPFQVAMYARPGRIVKLDIEEETLTLLMHETFFWSDKRLQWHKNLDVPVEGLLLNASDVW